MLRFSAYDRVRIDAVVAADAGELPDDRVRTDRRAGAVIEGSIFASVDTIAVGWIGSPLIVFRGSSFG